MFKARLATKMNAVSTGDMILAGHIDDALQANKYLRRTGSDGVKIQVKDGVVTLSGHVRTATNKTNIESAVRSVAGIAQFENQLVADDRLTMTVAQTLGMDERMSGKQIGVNVQQGFVYLTGMATDATMRLLVAQLAASVPQVRGIVNRIQAPDVVPGDAEETLIQPVIGQVVYATDGELGYVQKLIINPYSRRVSAVVVDILETDTHRMASVLPSNTHSPQKHQRLIPSDALRCAASGAIFLTLDSNQPVNFISFNPNNFVAPPVDWQPPYPYPPSDVLFSR